MERCCVSVKGKTACGTIGTKNSNQALHLNK